MATATSGILSPNSYLLTQDAVARKLSHQEVMEQYHSSSYQQTLPSSYSHAYSSDSDTEVPYTQTSLNNSSEPQKRNKRKNFKPRCSQNVSSGEEVLNLSEFHENNNVNNNVRRRKPLTTPRKVVQDEAFSPMDLSSNTQEETGADSTERLSESDRRQSTDQMSRGSGQEYADSDSDDFTVENYRTQAENEEADENSEENESSRIPSSFSIHNLSKPHVSDPGLSFGHNLSSDQIAEMRSYAMNTMRELLGIYGLTSEVAESISRQLPLGAFNSGKIFDNLSLTPPKPTLNSSGAPLSEPPTPPSTPLSPKTPQDASKISTSFGSITITPASQYSKLSPSSTAQFSGAFGQNLHRASSPRSSYSNGMSSSPNADMGEFPYLGSTRDTEGRLDFKGNHRGIFPGGAPLSYLKTESSSPPLPESSPLSAMMQQSMSTSISRDSLSSSLLLSKSTSTMDYSKYVKKYSSSVECGSTYCKDLNYREHFHCLDCNARVFLKKEEMIRHFKWHKKRDESLQHGFMRYSPLDDCGERYANCTHNKKQTHYHCIQENCDKVYISTSDVQMHSNYHRKDSAIMQEGFQRYRATEECGASYCAFFGQRTTHFHCRRSGCRFTFKNKSDMEKHKTYHIKDEQLSRDGFKKFMKNELCPFENCRFSKVCNHIHCIRPQCSYVLHSSGQLFSHKRKHERKDSELAYRKYKLAQSMMKTLADGGMPQPQLAYNALSRDYEAQIDLANFYNSQSMSNTSNVSESLSDRNSPLSFNDESEGALAMDLSENSNLPEDSYNSEDFWRKYFQVVPEGHCKESCEFHFTEHYHCITDNCQIIFSSKESTKEHARNHEQQEMITYNFFTVANDGEFCEESCVYHNKEKHYHCNIDNCKEIILSSDKPFRRLEHYKMHQYSQKLSMTKDPLTATHLTTSVEGMFGRKRGRPPKNRVIEVWNDYNTSIGSQSLMDSPQAIFTSFKLPKPSTILSISKEDDEERSSYSSKSPNQEYLQGFEHFADNTKCSDNLCHFLGRTHFHCARSRCFYATDKEETLTSHARDFHDNVKILEGFEFFDSNINCRLQICPSNGTNRHYHCTRCNYTFVQYSEMSSHNLKHMDGFREAQNFPSIRVKSEELLVKKTEMKDNEARAINLSQPSDAKHVVKAAGTFYPISTLPGHQPLSEHKNQINLPEQSSSPMTEASVSASLQLYGPETCCSRPFCKLKRKSHYHCNACNQAFSELDKLLPHVAKHSSGALHPSGSGQEDNNNSDNLGENGAQSPENLSSRPPEQKISVAPIQSLQNPQMPTESPQKEIEQPNYFTPTFDAYNHFANFPTNFASQISLMQQQNPMFHQGLYQHGLPPQLMFQHAQLLQNPLLGHQAHGFSAENLTSPLAAMAANINKRTLSDHEMTPEAKKARVQSSMRILKDEPVPVGYLRFRFNEDCKYQHCGYREHQTHFHCQRHDCGYSFCDKTRFVQHTARHERLDTLMGGDFQQYRANVSCGRQDCNYIANLGSTQNKASHFHCLKCEFVCTDTNKVVAHRRQHQKLDSIQAAGFEKFTPSQICRVSNCQHSGKQTHYHCLQCQYAVLGLAQMSAHKYRHMDN